MRIGFFSGLDVEVNGVAVPIAVTLQRAALFGLALEAGGSVSYRELEADLWPFDEVSRASIEALARPKAVPELGQILRR